jgi:hypothetical protein
VRTVLFDLTPNEVQGPLWDFQHTRLHKQEDMLKFVKSINEVADPKLSEHQINRLFELTWPGFVDALDTIRVKQAEQEAETGVAPRKPGELLGEVLERVRTIDRDQLLMSSQVGRVMRRIEDVGDIVGVRPEARFVAHPEMGTGEIIEIGPKEAVVSFDDGRLLRVEFPALDQFGRFDSISAARKYHQLHSLSDDDEGQRANETSDGPTDSDTIDDKDSEQ